MKKTTRMWSLLLKALILMAGIFAILQSFHFFSEPPLPKMKKNFYVFFTNLSNYACIAYILFEFLALLVGKKKQLNASPLKFALTVGITITFLVSHTILAGPWGDNTDLCLGYIWEKKYWQNLTNPLLHLAVPVLFIIDYLAFSRGKLSKLAPVHAVFYLLLYVAFIYIRVIIIKFKQIDTTDLVLFPYPFLNYDDNSWTKVGCYIGSIAGATVGISLVYYFLTCSLTRRWNKKNGQQAN